MSSAPPAVDPIACLCAPQVQQAVLSSGMEEAPHVVAPIRAHGSSAMAISYLNELSSSLGDKSLTPEFLSFRTVTSAMLAQVSESSSVSVGTLGTSASAAEHQHITGSVVLVCLCCTTQVVSEPFYAKILAELLYSARGQEMYLRSPESLNIPLGAPG